MVLEKMKKAVSATGGKQYVVTEGEVIDIELLNTTDQTVSFEPLLVINGADTKVGTPTVVGSKVTATVTVADYQGEKVTAIRYKAKKRVHKLHGHRQHHTTLKIDKIT